MGECKHGCDATESTGSAEVSTTWLPKWVIAVRLYAWELQFCTSGKRVSFVLVSCICAKSKRNKQQSQIMMKEEVTGQELINQQ